MGFIDRYKCTYENVVGLDTQAIARHARLASPLSIRMVDLCHDRWNPRHIAAGQCVLPV